MAACTLRSGAPFNATATANRIHFKETRQRNQVRPTITFVRPWPDIANTASHLLFGATLVSSITIQIGFSTTFKPSKRSTSATSGCHNGALDEGTSQRTIKGICISKVGVHLISGQVGAFLRRSISSAYNTPLLPNGLIPHGIIVRYLFQ